MDALYHDQWARRLAAGDWWGSGVFFRAPLYPYFLGLLYALTGTDYLAVRLVQFAIGAGTAVLTAVLAGRRFGRPVGIIAGSLVAVYGPLIYFEGELLLVVLEAPLNLLAAWSLDRAITRGGRRSWLIAGLWLGLRLWSDRPSWPLSRWSAVYLAAAKGARCAPALAPLRRRRAGDRESRACAQCGRREGISFRSPPREDSTTFSATTPPPMACRRSPPISAAPGPVGSRTHSARQRSPPAAPSNHPRSPATGSADLSVGPGEHPGAFLRLQARKLLYFWDAYEIPNNQDYYFFSRLTRIFRHPLLLGFGVLGPLALAGLALGLARRRLPFAWGAVPLTLAAVVVAFFVCDRFRVVLVPLFAVWAAAGIVWAFESLRERRRSAAALYGVVLCASAWGMNADLAGHRRNHSRAESNLRMGIYYAARGDKAQAFAFYKMAVSSDAGFADGWNNLGVAQAQGGDLATARDSFEAALKAQPRHPKALGNLASLALQEGRYAEADSLARRTLRVAGRDPEALYNAAVVLGNLGDVAVAGEAFHQIVFVQPWNAAARLGEAQGAGRAGAARRGDRGVGGAGAGSASGGRARVPEGDRGTVSVDLALFRLINIAWGWDALAPVMRFFSGFVYWLPLLVLLALWMLFRDGRRGRITVLLLLFLVPTTDQVSSHLLKPLVGRPRPCRVEAGIAGVRTHGARCSHRGSFPSSHAANVAAVAALLALRYRRARLPAGLIAFMVGYSRVYLGVHYPSDVAGGWLLGALLGGAAAGIPLTMRRCAPTLLARGWNPKHRRSAACRNVDTR